jgi:hypothetical protein
VQPVLKVGDVKQQVTVQAETEQVQTERASVETTIEQKQIRDLPLNGRIAVQLVELTPGMLFLGIGLSANSSANVDGAAVEGMGAHPDATQFQVDGMSAKPAWPSRTWKRSTSSACKPPASTRRMGAIRSKLP